LRLFEKLGDFEHLRPADGGALEAGGVTFTNGDESGVKLRKPET